MILTAYVSCSFRCWFVRCILSIFGASCALLLAPGCAHRAVGQSGPANTVQHSQEFAMQVDQENTAAWDKAWTNLLNDAEQSFRPSLPKLVAVEVELVVGNPGAPEDELTLTLLDASGNELAIVSQTDPASDSGHTMFIMSKSGIRVSPGQTYRLKLTGGVTFGWKYVKGGYQGGEATFNGKPLLPDARSTFLFRTFGAR